MMRLFSLSFIFIVFISCGSGKKTGTPDVIVLKDGIEALDSKDNITDASKEESEPVPEVPDAFPEEKEDLIALDVQDVPDEQAGDDFQAVDADIITPEADAVEEEIMPGCEDNPKPAGCPCSDNSDCINYICLDNYLGKKCASLCPGGGGCPENTTCTPMNIGGDIIYVCVFDFVHLCQPCLNNNSCAPDGKCYEYGSDGFFCGGNCTENTECPKGYICGDAKIITGETVKQCMPADSMCPCYEPAIKQGLSTSCHKKNVYGNCEGSHYCTENGLSECTASNPEPEQCDGIDNNCEGTIDEGNLCLGEKICLLVNDKKECACALNQTACDNDTCCDTKNDVTCCGNCTTKCEALHVETSDCQNGQCVIIKCEQGFENIDGNFFSGCSCEKFQEFCDGKDNDCDNQIDEEGTCLGDPGCEGTCQNGFCICPLSCDPCGNYCYSLEDYKIDPNNCGFCGHKCENLPNTALHKCKNGKCCPSQCAEGYKDCNNDCDANYNDGCEFVLKPEICNKVDDNCNGKIDEDSVDCTGGKICLNGKCTCPPENQWVQDCGSGICEDLTSQVTRCGSCTNDCTKAGWPHVAEYKCEDKNCDISVCEFPAKYFNADGNPLNGCECEKTNNVEICNTKDDDCNGITDETPNNCVYPKTCQTGECKCPKDNPNIKDCMGVCTDIRTDKYNCGFCGNDCYLVFQGYHVDEVKCEDKDCKVVKCIGGYLNCDGLDYNGCEFLVKPEECNGEDDNCNGAIDEDPAGVGVECSTSQPGLCNSGHKVCKDGTLICMPDIFPGQYVELCNKLDDDCDSLTDEGNPEAGNECILKDLLGECIKGKTECKNGNIICVQIKFPVGETCNNKDDDCNGTTDQITTPCYSFCGTGDKICSEGQWGECDAPESKICKNYNSCMFEEMCLEKCPDAPAEICNNKDDNCNSQTDEGSECKKGLIGSCEVSCGATPPVTGMRTCNEACVWGPCNPPSTETCNGKDDNCNNLIDEGYDCGYNEIGNSFNCTTSCTTPGSKICLSSCKFGPCTAPDVEYCDGMDNNCNGLIDETFDCKFTEAGIRKEECIASCGTLGIKTCKSDCTFGACIPPDEVCNSIDDNCNAQTDEGFTCKIGEVASCTTSCNSTGKKVCLYDCTWGECVPPEEKCNNADDDCDNAVDEENAGGCEIWYFDNDGDLYGVSSTTKCLCKAEGKYNTKTLEDCNDNDAQINPKAQEKCNHIDDNCNNQTDEGFPDVNEPNETMQTATYLQKISESGNVYTVDSANINSGSDADWFKLDVQDKSLKVSLYFNVWLKNIPSDAVYKICVYYDEDYDNSIDESKCVQGTGSVSFYIGNLDEAFDDNSGLIYIQITSVSGSSCDKYTLQYQWTT